MDTIFSQLPFEITGIILAVATIITLTTFSRHIVGLRGLGTAAAILLTFAFLSVEPAFTLPLDALLLYVGYVAILLLVGHLVRSYTLLHMPKISLILTSTLLVLLGAVALIHQLFGLSLAEWIIPILIYASLTESLYSTFTRRGVRDFITLNIETIVVGLVAYFIVRLGFVQFAFVTYPWLILIGLILTNVLLGRWTGPRISEVVKYKKILTS